MSMSERLMARGERAVEERRARLVAAVMHDVEDVRGVAVEVERDGIVLSGRGLRRRWLSDPRLRFAGILR